MKIAVYGDAHITRRLGNLQEHWETSVLKVFRNLYQEFESNSVETAVCLGDLFDKAVLEAKSVKLVLTVLNIMNSATFPTYLLLGNHEIDSTDSNVLEYLSEYDQIIPVTSQMSVENKLTFIPYSTDIEDVSANDIKDHYVFTHHDIYGSELASGKVKASFGTDPSIFKKATYVFNGHVHLNSKFGNICNVGSILKMQQGELRINEFPKYYYLDTVTNSLEEIPLREDFIAYLTVEDPSEINSILCNYPDSVKFVLRVRYTGEDTSFVELHSGNPRILMMSLRKNLPNTLQESSGNVKKSPLDIKEFLTNYINRDESVSATDKNKYIDTGLSLLGG